MNIKKNIILDNVLFALSYWGISHINWIIFNKLGVLPMPVWPAAGLALVGSYYWGWAVAPGIALGTFLANYFSLGAPLVYALLIPVMNTLGPVSGGLLLRKRVSRDLKVVDILSLMWVFLIGLFYIPALSAAGGIGFKWLLGLAGEEGFFRSWLKWYTAHASGTLLVSVPLFIILRITVVKGPYRE